MFFFYFLFHFAVAPLPPQGDGKICYKVYSYLGCCCTFTPARGRKMSMETLRQVVSALHLYPRKGTENRQHSNTEHERQLHLYPRKGTETTVLWPLFIGDHPCCTFTPARGRKLRKCSSRVRPQRCTFTPARGRKR